MPSFIQSPDYTAISGKEELDDVVSTGSDTTVWRLPELRVVKYSILLLALNSTIFIVWILGGTLSSLTSNTSEISALLKQTSGYSPIFDRFPFTLNPVYHNNTLFSDQVLRQRPGLAVEAAWEDLSRLTATTITADDVRAMGRDPALTVHMPNDPSSFPVMLSVTHQLHCLNNLRRGMEILHYHGNETVSRMYWEHMYHCLYLLTQAVTCHADVDLVVWQWVEEEEHPQPDFSGNMMCRNFNGLKSWLDNVGFGVDKVWHFPREGGEIDIAQEQGYLEYLKSSGSM